MAHIPDGVLEAPVLLAGAATSAAALAVGLRRLDYERIPQAAVLASALFVGSLISVPVGPSSVHPLLNGLAGVVLGWTAVPTIVAALVLQAVFFGYGGLMVLGVNACNLALPALLCAAAFAAPLRRATPRQAFWLGAAAGACGVGLSGAMIAATLALSDPAYAPAAKLMLLIYPPLMLAEAALTGAALAFVQRVAPELLHPGEPGR